MTAAYNSLKLEALDRIAAGEHLRIMALGDSTVEHFMVGAHWSDYVNIGLMNNFRRWSEDRLSVDNPATFLNAGISNSTSADLLARFSRDADPFRPDLLILMCGFNDANPRRGISPKRFGENLRALHEKVAGWGGEVLFNTPYACDREKLAEEAPEWAEAIPTYVDVIREYADGVLIDHFARWEPLRRRDIGALRMLLVDSLHLNPAGNAVIGLDILDRMGLALPEKNTPWISEGIFAWKYMNAIQQDRKQKENG